MFVSDCPARVMQQHTTLRAQSHLFQVLSDVFVSSCIRVTTRPIRFTRFRIWIDMVLTLGVPIATDTSSTVETCSNVAVIAALNAADVVLPDDALVVSTDEIMVLMAVMVMVVQLVMVVRVAV